MAIQQHKTYASRVGTVRLVRDAKTGKLMYVQRGGNQSAVDANGVSLDSYIHALYGLALQAKPKRVLMIGCAGGTLATMLTRAGVQMTVVDIDRASFTLARRHFGLPKSVACHTADGLRFMQKTKAKFDVVIIDAFVGEKIPPQFKDDAFCAAARRCVRKNGTLLVNVCLNGKADRTANDLALTLKRNAWRVRLIDQRGPYRNAIIMAGNVQKLRRPVLKAPPALDRKRIAYELKAMRFKRLLLR